MTGARSLLIKLFEFFNNRDFEAILLALHEDVDWPNETVGGRVVGRHALKAYWALNSESIQVETTPIVFINLPDGRVMVDVNQVVRGASGGLWSDIQVRQIYTLRDGLISRMDVVPLEP